MHTRLVQEDRASEYAQRGVSEWRGEGDECVGGLIEAASQCAAKTGALLRAVGWDGGRKDGPKVTVPVPVPSGGSHKANDWASALDRKEEPRPGTQQPSECVRRIVDRARQTGPGRPDQGLWEDVRCPTYCPQLQALVVRHNSHVC